MIKKEDVKPGNLVKVDGVASFDTGEPVLVVHHSVESVSGFSYYSEKKESCVFAIDKIEDNYVYITPIWKIYRDEHLDVPIDVMNMQLQLFMRNARMFQPRGSLLPPIPPSLDGDFKTGFFVNKQDEVSHPSHYAWLKDLCGVEPLDICRHLDFNTGNTIKYLLRKDKVDGNKTKTEKRVEDLRKAVFYIQDEIKFLEHGTD